jgi:hypothetical protein
MSLEKDIQDLTAAIQGLIATLLVPPAAKEVPVAVVEVPVTEQKPAPVVEEKVVEQKPVEAAITYEAVRNLLTKVNADKGTPTLKAILAQCDVEKVPHLTTPEQLAKAFKLGTEALA